MAGRPYCRARGEPEGQQYALIGGHFTGSMTRHVLESFAYNAGLCLHVRVLAGRDPHHIVEAQFKAVAPGAARRRRSRPRGSSGSRAPRERSDDGGAPMSADVVVLDYGSRQRPLGRARTGARRRRR